MTVIYYKTVTSLQAQQRINSLSNCRKHSPCSWMLQTLKPHHQTRGSEHRGPHQSHQCNQCCPISIRSLGTALRSSPWSCPKASWLEATTSPAFPNSVTGNTQAGPALQPEGLSSREVSWETAYLFQILSQVQFPESQSQAYFQTSYFQQCWHQNLQENEQLIRDEIKIEINKHHRVEKPCHSQGQISHCFQQCRLN